MLGLRSDVTMPRGWPFARRSSDRTAARCCRCRPARVSIQPDDAGRCRRPPRRNNRRVRRDRRRCDRRPAGCCSRSPAYRRVDARGACRNRPESGRRLAKCATPGKCRIEQPELLARHGVVVQRMHDERRQQRVVARRQVRSTDRTCNRRAGTNAALDRRGSARDTLVVAERRLAGSAGHLPSRIRVVEHLFGFVPGCDLFQRRERDVRRGKRNRGPDAVVFIRRRDALASRRRPTRQRRRFRPPIRPSMATSSVVLRS